MQIRNLLVSASSVRRGRQKERESDRQLRLVREREKKSVLGRSSRRTKKGESKRRNGEEVISTEDNVQHKKKV